ncbi:uncharacterized protein LAJ45_09904 [Morchella importuna]|uniref:uncharacterized protein n=1 Tax=Morchella importuna TaxID=1174673 RepID=UPI001E8CC647|nr:uncharacterized protein LAJ45_09904 [Morchella importuna]KAH8145982.1 hypothetical protein LAJ45_09904 [Morchella importuna]
MSGTNNSAATPSYLDKAKDAMHSVVGNLTGHDDKETASKSFVPKVSSACTAAAENVCGDCETTTKSMKDTEGSTQKTAIKAMKDTDGAIQMTIGEAADMGGACKSKAAEAGDAIKKVFSDAEKNVEACDIMKKSSSEAGKNVISEDEKVDSKVLDDSAKKVEMKKDAHMHKSSADPKLMDGASDTKAEKMDIEEKSAEKADHKASHKMMDDKMDNKMDHKKMDPKMMEDEKREKTPIEKQATAADKMDDVSENAACAMEGSSCGKVVRDLPSDMHKYEVGEQVCSKNGSADIDIDTKGC